MQGRFLRHVERLKSTSDLTAGLPFSEHLSESSINELVSELQISFRSRIYCPSVTLWLFVSQVLCADGSCRAAVARLLAFCVARNKKQPSLETGSYCEARQRLPEELFSRLARQTGQTLHRQASASWSYHGRSVKLVDGSTASMPDTAENEAYFGKASNQHGHIGFPIVRFLAVFCLATGAMVELAMGPYSGKKTGELSLFRTLMKSFIRGDIVLADRLFSSYCDIAMLLERGVDVVIGLNACREVDFRKGRRLGKDDQIITWAKPGVRPKWMTLEQFHGLPQTLELRQVRVRVSQAGFRTKTIHIVTSLLDPALDTKAELGNLYRQRWYVELDLRSIKIAMHMDVLRCKTPEMVRKEIWTHTLAYNLLRTIMCSAAEEHGLTVRQLSFKGVKQILNAFLTSITTARSSSDLKAICDAIILAATKHQVAKRPNRIEPRKKKRRPKPYPFMTLTRANERKLCYQGT